MRVTSLFRRLLGVTGLRVIEVFLQIDSKLTIKVAPGWRPRTIRAHLPGILAYIRWRLTNGVVEGLNRKARMIVARAYGYHSAEALIAMLFLTCGGVQLHPTLP